MGVTIHYTLITCDPATVCNACRITVEEAVKAGYGYEMVRDQRYVFYVKSMLPLRDRRDLKGVLEWLEDAFGGFRAADARFDMPVDDVPREPPFAVVLLSYPDEGSFTYMTPLLIQHKGGEGPGDIQTEVQGVIVHPPQAGDKYTAESFDLLFYKIGRWYICRGPVKTQPFTMDEVEPNIRYHKWICGVLRKVVDSSPLWWHTYVSDEGDYYETLDESKLREAFTATNILLYMLAALDEALEKADANYTISVGGDKIDIRKLRKKASEHEERGAEAGEHEEGAEAEEEEYGYSRQTTLDEFLSGRGEDG
jgi:hypothetical protein